MKRDIITKIQTTYTPDGSGGYTEETIELGSFDVKLGVSNNVEKATSYGVSVEQILEVISDVPLLEDEAGLYLLIGPSGKDGYVGKDGVSPTIATEEIEGGVRVSVTDAQGTSSFELYNGADGNDGPQGPAGKDGAKGDKGDPGKDGKDGAKGEDGADGFSPLVTVKSNTDTQYILTIQDKRGSFDTPNLKGQDGSGEGSKGEKGDDGFSPTVDMEWNTEGIVGIKFTVTDARGTSSEILPAGPAGQDGYTPVRGTDYWTEADQTAIINAVLEALPSAEGVGF